MLIFRCSSLLICALMFGCATVPPPAPKVGMSATGRMGGNLFVPEKNIHRTTNPDGSVSIVIDLPEAPAE